MPAAPDPANTSPATAGGRGYAEAAYAAALAHVGRPLELPRAGGWLLARTIPGSPRTDAIGPYPLLACADWSTLAADLDGLEDLVSVTAVIDPVGGARDEDLRAAFPDQRVEFKRHYLVDLEADFEGTRSSHHRRSVRKARGLVEVQRAADPGAHAAEWRALYASMVSQTGLAGGASDFPPHSLDAQLAVPGLRYYRALLEGQAVAASLWLVQTDRIYYHLGASLPVGRSAKASFALFDAALGHAAADGLKLASLGGVAGLEEDPTDGLAFFKRGWSTDSVVAWLAGRVCDPAAYTALGGEPTDFFPAYRATDKR
jgi:Acetyltransferase (GNAT) domain